MTDSDRILALSWRWEFLGSTAFVSGGAYVRRLFLGEVPGGATT